tara:strand:- start:80 stop:523 length:444 start_codon:yes stop_codon:yes gene_type:complete
MARYITPKLTITSNKYSAASFPGPTTSAINIDVTKANLDVTEVISKIIDVSTSNALIFDASVYTSGITIGTEGAFVFLRNLSSTVDIYIGHGSDGALEGATATRLMTMKPGEFAFLPYDLEGDLIHDASDEGIGALEAILFVRTGTA